MSLPAPGALDPRLDLRAYAAGIDAWLDEEPPAVVAAAAPHPDFAERVEAMRDLLRALFDAGWARYGWPVALGGCGGTIAHRAAMWEALARHGVPGMALFEHLEILAPVLAADGPEAFVADALPAFLSGRELWCQGFSEPDAGSDLASLRTTAVRDGDGHRITGRKIWTSWARYATWCLLLARTGTPESRHRGLTAFVVDLRDPGVEVSAIVQANGTDELAEVAFDGVHVPADRIVGTLDGGWAVAMHILSHERGTFAWFRHCSMYPQLLECADGDDARHDTALGNALLDLFAVTATGHGGVQVHAAGNPLGPRAAFTKLLLCAAERSVQDCALATDPELALGGPSPEVALRRQEYLFSRIVTVYGGSQQMQLDTIAKQILRAAVILGDDRDEYLIAAGRVMQSGADDPLDALGWWDLLPQLADVDARHAVFATLRAQGRTLATTPALGGLLAQPFIDGTALAPGAAVAAIGRATRRRGPVWNLLGDVGDRLVLFDVPGEGAFVVEPDELDHRPVDIPGRSGFGEVGVELSGRTPLLTAADAARARARSTLLGRLGAASEILGVSEGAVATSVEYAGDRRQFGRPIGTFQAVRHLLAWATTDCSAIDSAVREALLVLDDPPPHLDEIVKALAGRNGRLACERSLQVLGGIGFTAEHEHHERHSRVLLLDSLIGSSAELTNRLGAWLRSGGEPRFPQAALLAAGTLVQ